MKRQFLRFISTAWLTLVVANSQASDEQATSNAWQQLQDGKAIAIMRHALAPGTGDPSDFVLENCATQRNLSNEGRSQARVIGDLFRDKGIAAAQVVTSEWCRCQETARLLDLGSPETFATLNSFFQNRRTADRQTMQLREAIPGWLQQGSTPTILVTHQVNISALTGSFTRSGEILIINLVDDEVVVLTSIDTLN
ncbi:MAG: histidine phosphatase family protein [Granulosicoccus sp.]